MPRALSPECRLVFLSANKNAPANDEAIAALARGPINWVRVLAIAERENAVAALWRILAPTSRSTMPAVAADHFRRSAMVSDFRMLYLDQRVQETLRVLREHGVQVMLLKGAALAASVYSSFAERPMSDVDLLIRPADVERTRRALSASGWRENTDPAFAGLFAQHHHLAPFYDDSATRLRAEAHTALLPTDQPFAISSDAFWAAATPSSEAYSAALIPSTTHLLWHASVHFAWSHVMQFGAWRTFRDVNELIRSASVDWDEFVGMARRTRAASSCYWMLRLAARLSGAPIPADVLARLRVPTPESIRGALERHFIANIAVGEGAPCPSVRLTRQMWRLAIRPGWSGHAADNSEGRRREWEAVVRGPADPTQPGPFVRHVRGARHWWNYMVRTLVPLA